MNIDIFGENTKITFFTYYTQIKKKLLQSLISYPIKSIILDLRNIYKEQHKIWTNFRGGEVKKKHVLPFY